MKLIEPMTLDFFGPTCHNAFMFLKCIFWIYSKVFNHCIMINVSERNRKNTILINCGIAHSYEIQFAIFTLIIFLFSKTLKGGYFIYRYLKCVDYFHLIAWARTSLLTLHKVRKCNAVISAFHWWQTECIGWLC